MKITKWNDKLKGYEFIGDGNTSGSLPHIDLNESTINGFGEVDGTEGMPLAQLYRITSTGVAKSVNECEFMYITDGAHPTMSRQLHLTFNPLVGERYILVLR